MRPLLVRSLAVALSGLVVLAAFSTLGPAGARPSAAGASTETSDSGLSTMHVTGVCTARGNGMTCVGYSGRTAEDFAPEAPARAVLVATWTPACDACETLRIVVPGAGSAVGQSPLTLDLGAVDARDHHVEVWFSGLVAGHVTQEVSWTVTYG